MNAPVVSRRSFLKLFAAAAASNLIVPAFAAPRDPYVVAGKTASYVGLNLHPDPTFCGSTIVREIHDWDGLGYPCTVMNQAYGPAYAPMLFRFYDFDLSDFLVEVPQRFWHDPVRASKYPNVHAFVREQRFGEPVTIMLERMRQARLKPADRSWQPKVRHAGPAGAAA